MKDTVTIRILLGFNGMLINTLFCSGFKIYLNIKVAKKHLFIPHSKCSWKKKVKEQDKERRIQIRWKKYKEMHNLDSVLGSVNVLIHILFN
jgi:hypothetical protein